MNRKLALSVAVVAGVLYVACSDFAADAPSGCFTLYLSYKQSDPQRAASYRSQGCLHDAKNDLCR